MTVEKIKTKDLIALIPDNITLIYLDNNDNFDEHLEILQNFINTGNFEEIDCLIHDWFYDCRNDCIENIKKEMIVSLQDFYGFNEDDSTNLIKEYDDEISDIIYERDDSNIYNDLLKNTSTLIANYDTCYSMDSESWNWNNDRVNLEKDKIKDFLNIKTSKYDYDLESMIRGAIYGGQLLIYFEIDINNLFNKNINKIKSILFKDAHIGIINHNNGSGDITELPGHSFKIPFDKQNIFLEKSIKHNWTYEIACMTNDWCKSTSVEYLEEYSGNIDKSPTIELQKFEEDYNKIFKSGKCSFGDMDINRHRNSYYSNDIPCGNKCNDCGTFWI